MISLSSADTHGICSFKVVKTFLVYWNITAPHTATNPSLLHTHTHTRYMYLLVKYEDFDLNCVRQWCRFCQKIVSLSAWYLKTLCTDFDEFLEMRRATSNKRNFGGDNGWRCRCRKFLGTYEASRFDSISNRTSRFEFDSKVTCAVIPQTMLTHCSTKTSTFVPFVVEIYVYNSTLRVAVLL